MEAVLMKLNQKSSRSIRLSYEHSLLPSYFSSWLTGKPKIGQSPLFRISWLFYLLITVSLFIFGLLLGLYNQFFIQNIFVTMACWAALIFSSRRMAAVILHQSVHSRLTGNDFIDGLIGDLVTILMLTQDHKTYKVDHCEKHHAPLTFATKYDPIVQFFSVFGFHLGTSKRKLYIQLLVNLFSPRFHFLFFLQRLKYNFNIKRPIRSFIASLYLFILLGVSWKIAHSLLPVVIAYIIPMTFFYQVSALLEICSEHAWFESNIKKSEDMLSEQYFYADISWGRFCGSRYPYGGGSSQKIMWYAEQMLYHLPIRLFILVGDLPQHDYHHRHPLSFDWVNAKYNRELAANSLRTDEPEYIDIWGLHHAIDYVFTVISEKEDVYIQDFKNYEPIKNTE